MVPITGFLTSRGRTSFTQKPSWGRSWRPITHSAAQENGRWWNSQGIKFCGWTAKLPVKHSVKQSTRSVTKGIGEFPVKWVQTSKYSGVWWLQVPCEARSGVTVYRSKAASSLQDNDPQKPWWELNFNLFHFATNSPVLFVAWMWYLFPQWIQIYSIRNLTQMKKIFSILNHITCVDRLLMVQSSWFLTYWNTCTCKWKISSDFYTLVSFYSKSRIIFQRKLSSANRN